MKYLIKKKHKEVKQIADRLEGQLYRRLRKQLFNHMDIPLYTPLHWRLFNKIHNSSL